MESDNYWAEIERIDSEMEETFGLMKVAKDNLTHEELTDKLYELRQEKKALQSRRMRQVKEEKGLKRNG